ncbi:unconventional myosin-Va isoform X2 [Thrips palmi]|uniref:Unconventional myosin-Va isoform X2 n=1 Tax=Thrips palmi TaxID=161013 RepID=A0A6P8Z0Q9_THRPL|nr:unconventional myosin-Va isoform X2 [Thrips palmi]
MTTIELYTKGARVWVPNPECVWEGAEVQEDYKDGAGKLKLRLDASGKVLEVPLGPDKELPPLRNPDILVGENDLTSLSYLHEPAVLHNLQVRFCRHNAIYTYCGIVLVAINPYSELPIYGSDTVWTYRGQSMGDLDPHIFAVAEEAYTKLERESRDQSIIVSGESGAGKTVSAKYAMRYFAIVGGSSTETQVEKKVLASSPIMEAIGNAKTTRNDNSSRFGKYIEIHFDRAFHIVGASMRTYLLEKSRVVFQAPEERNYHVFYQLCASRDQYPELKLAHPDEFVYLNGGQAATIDSVDDSKSFQDMVSALTLLGFGPKEQNDMWRVLAAVLHLGNVHLTPQAEGTTVSSKDRHLAIFCELLEIDMNELRTWLCQRRIVSVREVLNTPMNVTEATAAKDALAKHIYAELFNWIVAVVNKALESGTNTKQKFIGVLDIYGFETFEINSFEQFCINYANEKLQQQFNQHVFKLEQEEYLKEEIEWKFIDFYDNQPCIDLIETRLGILDLLDEECRVPKGKDSSWAEKLYSQCTKWKHFSKPRFGTSAFVIKHFADNVQYEVGGFLEKNRDTVMEEQITVLRGGKNNLVQKLFADESRRLVVPAARVKVGPSSQQPQSQSKQNKKTVGSQFRDSLNMLMSTLNATTPHYIRCIKPNDSKKPFEYNAVRAVQQLRACGVLETIRISAAGFPSRWTYGDFFHRYRVLCKYKDIDYDNLRATCGRILKNLVKDEDKYKFGRTKLFFRAGQVAYMEKLRADRLRMCCIKMQAQVRGFIARKRYLRTRKAASTIQRWVRGFIARRRVYHIRREHAATVIQRYVRGWVKRKQYLVLRRSILGIQRYGRGLLARRRYLAMRFNHAAIVIQTAARRWLCRKQYLRNRKRVIVAQSAVRRFLAKRHFKTMKREARSVEHVKKLNKGLENKIISLQQKIGELVKENTSLKSVNNEANELRQRLDVYKGLEAELKRANQALKLKDSELEKLQLDLQKERDEKMDLISEEERWKTESKQFKQKMEADNQHLKERLDAANEQIKLNQLNAEEILKARLEQEKQVLIREQDQDRSAYQKLLRDFHALEQRSDQMEHELARIHREGGNIPATLRKNKHQRTSSNTSSMSFQDDVLSVNSEVPDDSADHGYGSVRSNTSPSAGHLAVESIDWQHQTKSDSPEANPALSGPMSPGHGKEVGLVLQMQAKLDRVTTERERLSRRLEALDKDLTNLGETTVRTQEAFRVQELEMENQKLKSNLAELRQASAKGNTGQFQALELELERRREECIQLHTVLSDKTSGMKNIAQSSYGKDVDIMNEDGELVLAFEAQKKINRQLEDELQAQKEHSRAEREEMISEMQRVLEDNEKLQSLFTETLAEGAQAAAGSTQAYLQYEVEKLTANNLQLREKYDALAEQNQKLKAQIKALNAKIKSLTGSDTLPMTGGVISSRDINAPAVKNRTNQPPQPAPRSTVDAQSKKTHEQATLPIVRKRDREYLGMFEYAKEDEHVIITRLINDLKPKTAVTLLPGLPAYILMMCIRHTDYINDDEKVRSLLTGIINTMKKLIKKKYEDLDTIVLWLSNALRLLHNMKQYSGDKSFQEENTPKQNEQCLRNFDLAEYRQVLSDVAVWVYQALISILEERIQPYVVPAILENEAITGLLGRTGGGGGRRGRLMSDTDVKPGIQQALDGMLAELTSFYRTLGYHGVDPEVIAQVFRQLFYFICASSLNNLLLRKDLCHWSKGMQIRYNLSHLEQWTRDHKLQDPSIIDTLAPIIQAAQLLQARKSDEDVQSVSDMCDRLTIHQIIKLLNLYTPADDYEEKVPISFIHKIQATLQERAEAQSNQFAGEQQVTLLMDSKQSFPVRFPFNPSNIRLEDIEVPEVLNIPMLKKI